MTTLSNPNPNPNPNPNTSTARGTAGLVVGIASLLTRRRFFLPLVGLFLAGSALRKEPASRGRARWGIALNLLAVLKRVIAVVLLIVVLSFVAQYLW